MQDSPAGYLLDARRGNRDTFVQLRLRNAAAACGPYTHDGARARAASYYHRLPGVVGVEATTRPRVPAPRPGRDVFVTARHSDGRRAVIGPFDTRDEAGQTLAGLVAGLGDELADWRTQIGAPERVAIPA
jgi:hypothetical protein